MKQAISLLLLWLASIWITPSILAQDNPTPTPDAEGIISIIVQPNDSLWSIAARARIPLAELLSLNGLSEDAVINPGDTLILGYGPPPIPPTQELPTPTVTTTRPPPTPTETSPPPEPTGLCLTAFDDRNQNGKHEPHEPLKATVAFTVFDEETVITNYITNGRSEPFCLYELAAGTYKIARSVSPQETLTTPGDGLVTLTWGTVANLAFGSYVGPSLNTPTVAATRPPLLTVTPVAASNLATPIPPASNAPPTEDGRFPFVAILISGLLLVAVLSLWIVRTITTKNLPE